MAVMKKKTLIVLLLINVVWAGTYPATKYLMQDTPFFLVTSLRYLIALAPLLLLAWLRYGLAFTAGDLLRCAVIGIATFTLCPALMYYGVGLSRAADAAILTSAEPLLVSLGAYFYLRERVDRRTVAALLIAFGGALILSEVWRGGQGDINPLGTFFILAGVCFEAVYSVVDGALKGKRKKVKEGLEAAKVGVILFLVGLVFFELVLGISGFGLGRLGWPILLIGLGVFVLIRAVFRRED